MEAALHISAGNAGESSGFAGAIVAQFESRLEDSMRSLVLRHGGVPWSAPALSEVVLPDSPETVEAIAQLCSGNTDIVVLLTGVATRYFLASAERAGRLEDTLAALASCTTVCRGPKPAFALRQNGIRSTHLVPEPHTTADLLSFLSQLDVAGVRTLILSAGEKFEEPSAFLASRGAVFQELQLYRWDLDDSAAQRLHETIGQLIDGDIRVAAFTTQVQVRHLFEVARRGGTETALVRALNERVLVGAVGTTCAAALLERGVDPDVLPDHPKMGHLVVALARAFSPAARNAAQQSVSLT